MYVNILFDNGAMRFRVKHKLGNYRFKAMIGEIRPAQRLNDKLSAEQYIDAAYKSCIQEAAVYLKRLTGESDLAIRDWLSVHYRRS